MNITKLVLIRHGESKWNKENRFTGWTDINLTNKGKIEAKTAAKLLKLKGFIFDIAYTSVLKRAIYTLWIILKELNQFWIPVEKSWMLNERHYGALQGFNKTKIIQKYGESKVIQWRRGFNNIPPALNINDKRFPGLDIRYSHIDKNNLPTTESLSLTLKRVSYYWNNNILKNIKNNKKIIIVAHGNSIRAIIKFLNNLDENEIIKIEVPTGIPLIYEFDNNLNILKNYYLK